MDDAADHPPIVDARLAARIGRQMRLDLRELRVGQPELIPIHRALPFGSRESQALLTPTLLWVRTLVLQVGSAADQDRDGAVPLLKRSRRSFPFIERVFADSAYAGETVARATRIAIDIVRAQPGQVGFAVQPRRWVVERFFAWINRNRRLAKDFEATIASATAFLYAASVMLLVPKTRSFDLRFKSNS